MLLEGAVPLLKAKQVKVIHRETENKNTDKKKETGKSRHFRFFLVVYSVMELLDWRQTEGTKKKLNSNRVFIPQAHVIHNQHMWGTNIYNQPTQIEKRET